MRPVSFERYLKERMKDPAFAEAFRRAGEDWDVALQLAVLRKQSGLSQAALARKLNTSQQQICRLESSHYQGHSLRTLKKVAKALQAQVFVVLLPMKAVKGA
jgi:DNA-binding XRE family transcriptional regulator